MENMHEINQKIANNLIRFRKASGLTQAELAEKINYSDKSVSKWESGNGIPDVYTLIKLAKLFDVTLDDFVGEDAVVENKKKNNGSRLLIILLSSGIVWLVATCMFVMLGLIPNMGAGIWLVFLYAIAVNAILLIVYAGIWKYRLLSFFSVSTLIWMALTCLYFTVKTIMNANGVVFPALWMVFLLGIPLQVLEALWVFFRSLFGKNRIRRRKEKTQTLSAAEELQEGSEKAETEINHSEE